MNREVPIRIIVVSPQKDVLLALQQKKGELVSPVLSTGKDLTFDLALHVGAKEDEKPNFLGPFVRGPKQSRFVYLNSGTCAGQEDSCWTRRAKISLQGITWTLIHQLAESPRAILQARIAGKAKDGGPACATVPLLNGGWCVVAARASI